ncbi:hypothetical protein QA612_21555 [Evansella sp. AB-P1]|uniref:hypothetical protein n=1 Tax=Evansella sp. AB-P1 TaxID=3037653 RepID=UPI00241E57AA|nr:hypothetical protein [Evansella sp. AB-P1]MDG5790045.1 hypothetical protein [Evansella sp. AB-P1]
MSVVQLVMKTMPFLISRILVYALFGLISFLFLGLMIGISILLFRWFEFGAGFFFFIIAATFFTVLAGLRFLERYVLYMVKVGHIAVITELLRTGKVPEGKSQVAYGKDQVVNNFGSANVAFVVDKIVYAAVRQIQRWMMRVGNFLGFIPGAKNIISIISKIMEVSLRYVDEAILSYIMVRKSEGKEESVWKSACDGVVLYAQSWKKIIMTAAGIVAFVYVLNIGVFLITVFPLMALANWIANSAGVASFLGYIAVVGAYIITSMVKRALIDPVATVAMVRAYQLNIKDMEPSMDLQAKLLKVSGKFKSLFNKSKEDTHEIAATTQDEKGITPSV